MLDNILDYLNYVIVAAAILFYSDLLPASLRLAGALSILLTSVYQFTQQDAKTEDNYFKGFPSYWNILAAYMLILHLDPWVNLAILALCNVLVFVPVKYVYPSRNPVLHRPTLILSYLYGVVNAYGILLYPAVPGWVIWASLAYVL